MIKSQYQMRTFYQEVSPIILYTPGFIHYWQDSHLAGHVKHLMISFPGVFVTVKNQVIVYPPDLPFCSLLLIKLSSSFFQFYVLT